MVGLDKIKAVANNVSNYSRKYHKLPERSDYNKRVYAYILIKFVATGKKVPLMKVGPADNYNGKPCNITIPKKDYMELAKKLAAYIEKHGKLPNNLPYKTYKIPTRVYTYAYGNITKYYFNTGKFPDKQKFYYSVFEKPKPNRKYGRSTEYGCDNRGQNNGHFCGPHMIQEIIRNLTGKVISQSTLAEVIGTTSDGSDHDGLNTSIAWFNKKYSYNLKVEWKNFGDLGWSGIKRILESNNKDCGLHELYRNTWGHYTNFDRIYDDYIDVHNSLGDYCDQGCYCGYTEERDKSEAESYLGGISQKSVMVVTNETN